MALPQPKVLNFTSTMTLSRDFQVHLHNVAALESRPPYPVVGFSISPTLRVHEMIHHDIAVQCHIQNARFRCHSMNAFLTGFQPPHRGHGPQVLHHPGTSRRMWPPPPGVPLAQAQPQGAVGHSVGPADGQQHMAGGQGAGGAGGAGGGADACGVSSRSRDSPSMPSKQKLTLPGRRCSRSPLTALWGNFGQALDQPGSRRP